MISYRSPIIILECANSHAGSKTILEKTIKKFCKINYSNLHIKFQPFKYDNLSTKTYNWYNVYKKLFFDEIYWKKIIELAFLRYKGVWIDINDNYSLKILESNIHKIYGVKLQSSILNNKIVFQRLKKLNLKKTKLIINISGYGIKQIKYFLFKFHSLHFEKVILQIGFQSYPTKISDIRLNRIKFLMNKLNLNFFSFADHLDSNDPYSLYLPSIASLFGANIIEKHIALKGAEAKYDGFSSLNYKQIVQMFKYFEYQKLILNSKISINEKKYLKSTIQKPVLNKNIKPGSLVSKSDIDYKRSNEKSLSYDKFVLKQAKYYVVRNKLKKDQTLNLSYLRKAKIAVIIACRLKSKRLKNKALIKIDRNLTLIEKCIKSCKDISDKIKVILATSNLKEDQELERFSKSNAINFVRGDKEDVIKRYLKACKTYKVDVILRVTGDCPYVSKEICNYLLKKHFEEGADFTESRNAPVGAGCQIINTEALKKVIFNNKKAPLSEYMSYYFTNNPNFFKLNIVDLPKWMIRKYRLTVDYIQDINFFKKIYSHFYNKKFKINLKNLYKFLDNNKKVVSLNSNLKLRYKTDKKLIYKLLQQTKINEI